MNDKSLKKLILALLSFFWMGFFGSSAFSHEVKLIIKNVVENSGPVKIGICSSEKIFNKHGAEQAVILEATGTEIETTLELEDGDYAFSMFQDLNDDGKMNTTIIGMPKEPFGFSNYDGKSIPGNFNKHKVAVNQDTEIVLTLFMF